MTKCAVSTFVTKYTFYGILYPYSVRHNIRTIEPIFMKFWQELNQLIIYINLVLDVFLLIANSKHACTDRERRFLSKGNIRAILSPYLAEHNLLTVQPIFLRFFVLIRRSCVLCLTINFFALFIDRAAVLFNTVLVCRSGFGIVHAPCLAVLLVVCKLLFNLYLHEIMS